MPITLNFRRQPTVGIVPDETPILDRPFFDQGSEEYKRDLQARNGGLKVSRQQDLNQIKSIAEGIKAGSISAEEAQRWSHRNPGAASVFNAALALREQNQKIQSIAQRNFSAPQPGYEAAGPLLPGEQRQMVPPQPARFNRAQAIQDAIQMGILSPETMKVFDAAQTGVPVEKPLTTSNVINTINPKTGKSEIVTVDQAVREGRAKAPTSTRNVNINDEFIKPDQLTKFRDANGQTPPLGTTYGDLRGENKYALTELDERKQLRAAKSAELLIKNLAETALGAKTPIFAQKREWSSRIAQTFENAFTQMSQGNVDLETFNSNRRASLSLIIRALGEVGTLNVQDIERIDNAIPRADGYQIFSGNLVDTTEVAREKFRKLASFLKDMRESLRKRGQGPTPPSEVEKYLKALDEGTLKPSLTSPALPPGWTVTTK